MHRPNRLSAIALLTTLAIVLSACGSSDSDTESSGASASTDAPDGATEPTAPNGDAGDPAGESGSGTVSVDGVEHSDFVGECLISRGLDPVTYEALEVGDLSTEGLNVVVGIDNVASGPEVEANYVMVGATTFRMAGIGGPGTIDSIDYVGPPPSTSATELVLVAFSGTTDDGLSVVAEVVCEVGLG